MSENKFLEKEPVPNDELLKKTIGLTFKHLEEIRTNIRENYGETIEEWKYYGKKYGWTLKTFLKKRNLFFITAYEDSFNLVFIFGDKAVRVIEESDISPDLKEQVLSARKYAEGRGLTIHVNNDTYVKDIKKLIDIKIKN